MAQNTQVADSLTKASGRITAEALAALRERIGARHPIHPWNSRVSHDAVRHFALGYGDDNPLWHDAGYARTTRHVVTPAPPTFLYSAFSAGGGGGHGLPGVFGLHGSSDWEWYSEPHVGDDIGGYTYLAEVNEKETRYGGTAVEQVQETMLFAGGERPLARFRHHLFRFDRNEASKRSIYSDVDPPNYSSDAIEGFREEYRRARANRRGSQPRRWAEVSVGDRIGPMLKGPITINGMIAFLMGWGSPLCKADGVAFAYWDEHPKAMMLHPETGVPEFPEAAHWDRAFAVASGLPYGYDLGACRVSWAAQLLTDWMGDDGTLKALTVRLKRPNFIGDINRFTGTVVEKAEPGTVRIEIEARNQRDDVTTVGSAEVVLAE